MIGLVFHFCPRHIRVIARGGTFHQILYILCSDGPWERRDWPRPRTNRRRSSLLSVTLLLTSSCKKKVGGGFTSEPRAAEHSLRVSFFVCSSVFSPTSFSLSSCLLSSFFNLTFLHPPSCWITQSLSFHPPISLSSEYLCNSYSYLLVGARIRASLLMCSRSPRGRGDRENILKS